MPISASLFQKSSSGGTTKKGRQKPSFFCGATFVAAFTKGLCPLTTLRSIAPGLRPCGATFP